ncbi:DUF692 domain-containing protein [Parendozoicomonas haliclonae]|uniref:DUF692 domain-containing protein n=1 Tax=Parendozoicomonas haliclonae TaxID=1960125 RepID=A0A1X7AKZ2_9GAMM|nr:DUF692 domain-containing protein [Parendozoicomonas haliclonae]SMA48482.1 hypothetical protein EHSB41UT_02758 [Parendozoicomonas haliclonae]
MTDLPNSPPITVGVGLRHPHFQDALQCHPGGPDSIDFLEVHAENFFAPESAATAILKDIASIHPVSIHGTAMGLGSLAGIPDQHLTNFAQLVDVIDPLLVSEHAAFTWGTNDHQVMHSGDLLPIPFNQITLQCMADNVQRIQERLGRTLLIENLSAYITPEGSTFSETQFLTELTQSTGCQLLVDINNLAVNAHNNQLHTLTTLDANPLTAISQWLNEIPEHAVGELHLAGCSPDQAGRFMVDDHGYFTSEIVWKGYELALQRFGAVPTLIEWDTNLPDWQTLMDEARKARSIAHRTLNICEVA